MKEVLKMPLYVKIEVERDGQLHARVGSETTTIGIPIYGAIIASESTVSQLLRSLATRFAEIRTGSKPLEKS